MKIVLYTRYNMWQVQSVILLHSGVQRGINNEQLLGTNTVAANYKMQEIFTFIIVGDVDGSG